MLILRSNPRRIFQEWMNSLFFFFLHSFFVSPTPDLFLALYIQLKCIWILHLEGWDHIPRILFSSRTYQQALHWNVSCATIVYGHFLINAARVVVVLHLMRRECLLYLSFFIFLVFHAKSVFFPFWRFSLCPLYN